MKIFAVRGTISLQWAAYTHVYAGPHFKASVASPPPGRVVLAHSTEGEPVVGDLRADAIRVPALTVPGLRPVAVMGIQAALRAARTLT